MRFTTWLPIVFCPVLLCACVSDPVALKTRPLAIPAVSKIEAPVAFSHSRAFREELHTVRTYGTATDAAPLKTGEASDRLMRSAYATMFRDVREAAPSASSGVLDTSATPTVLLQPEFAGIQYLNASRTLEGPYYSAVHYRFTLSRPDGIPIARWTVHGFGEFDPIRERGAKGSPDYPKTAPEIYSEATLRAIEAAVARLVRSLERVPELIAWTSGGTLTPREVPASDQRTERLPDAQGYVASYPDAFTLEMRRASLPEPPSEVERDAKNEKPAPVLAVRIALRNDSSRRFALDPAEIEWVLPDGAKGEPLPGPVGAALIAGQPFRMMVGVMGPGLAALPAALAALASAASISEKKKQLASWDASIRREVLQEGVANAKETRGGLVLFVHPQRPGGELIIPVVDLDRAARYSVRVPYPIAQ